MHLDLPIRIEHKIRATSTYTPELIEKRLAQLADRDDVEAVREKEYLRQLQQRQVSGS